MQKDDRRERKESPPDGDAEAYKVVAGGGPVTGATRDSELSSPSPVNGARCRSAFSGSRSQRLVPLMEPARLSDELNCLGRIVMVRPHPGVCHPGLSML